MRIINIGIIILVCFPSLTSAPAEASIFKKIGHAIGHTERAVGHAVGHTERAIGHATLNGVRAVGREAVKVGDAAGNGTKAAVKFVDKEAATPVGKAAIKYTGKGLDYLGTGLDHLGNTLQNTPIVGAAAPLAHDASKALHSKTAHWAAAVGAGLAVGGGLPFGSVSAGHVAFAAGSGGMTGYYGRQAYLGARCINGHTKTCDRLQSKP